MAEHPAQCFAAFIRWQRFQITDSASEDEHSTRAQVSIEVPGEPRFLCVGNGDATSTPRCRQATREIERARLRDIAKDGQMVGRPPLLPILVGLEEVAVFAPGLPGY